MTLATLLFLRDLLASQTLTVGHPEYRETVAKVGAALDELDSAIAAAKEPTPGA